MIRLAAVRLETPNHPLLGTIILIYRITRTVRSASHFDTARGLFQLRVIDACVIRLAAMRLETPNHPLLGTITLFYQMASAVSSAYGYDAARGLSRPATAELSAPGQNS